LSTVPSLGSAKPDSQKQFRKLWEAGLKVKRKAGLDQWLKFLDSKGFDYRGKKTRDAVPLGGQEEESSGGFSTQNLETNHLDRVLVVASNDDYRGTHVAHFDWDWVVTDSRSGEPPKDPVSIGWNDNFYDLEDTYVDDPDYHDGEVDSISLWETTSTGAVFKYVDKWIDGNTYESNTWTCGCGTYMNAIGSSSSLRDVMFKYYHTWNNVSIDGISWGTGGPSVQFGSDTKQWVKRTQVDEGDRFEE
jgi:hypothetical protein